MDTEARLFKIVVFVVTLIIAAIMLTNIIYYSGMTNNQYPSKSEANAMLWISAIVFTLAALLWIWSIFRMFHKETREEFKKKATKKFTDWAYDPNSGITTEDINTVRSKFGGGDVSTESMKQAPPIPTRQAAPIPSAPPQMQMQTQMPQTQMPPPPPPTMQAPTKVTSAMVATRPPPPPPPTTGVIRQGPPPTMALTAES